MSVLGKEEIFKQINGLIKNTENKSGEILVRFWNKMSLPDKRFWVNLFFSSVKVCKNKISFQFSKVDKGKQTSLIMELPSKEFLKKHQDGEDFSQNLNI